MNRIVPIIGVALIIVIAGCGGNPDQEPVGPDEVESEPEGLISDPPPQNPWKSSNITVSITESSNPSRDYEPLLRQSLRYWNQNMSALGWEGRFVYNSNTSDPDVPVHIVDEIGKCGDDRDENLGCAPVNTRVGSGIDQRPVEIISRQNDTSTVRIAIHEFGHTLGLTHQDSSNWSVMNKTITAATVPQLNATERKNPFEKETLYVYYNETDTNALNEYIVGELQEVWDYFNSSENENVPGNVTFQRTENSSKADIEVKFVDDFEESGSTASWDGFDPDADGVMETYDTATINISESINQDNVAWHTGRWITFLFSNQKDESLPDDLRSRDFDTRQIWPN